MGSHYESFELRLNYGKSELSAIFQCLSIPIGSLLINLWNISIGSVNWKFNWLNLSMMNRHAQNVFIECLKNNSMRLQLSQKDSVQLTLTQYGT